ncbi:MAG: hypothetical protein R3B90_02745 [Planctomycetaceae bacterium]
MAISLTCPCGRKLRAKDEYAGTRAECPTCGRQLTIPEVGDSLDLGEPVRETASPPPLPGQSGEAEQAGPLVGGESEPLGSRAREYMAGAIDIVDFIDPPRGKPAAATAEPVKPVLTRMFEALLDPRAIHWLLTIGGGLAVLGLIVWLVSLRIFDDPRIVAIAMGIGSVSLMGAGWWTALKTRFKVAGQALTFLGCVVLPLNLWFYDAQNLVTVEGNLWVGGLICVLAYAATVYVLKDPLFMYAVEAGITLTALLILGQIGVVTDAGHLALVLTILAAMSIHAERAFAPDGEFSRSRYGLPLFWSGHVQLAAAVITLIGSQLFGWVNDAVGLDWSGNRLTENDLLAGGLWLAAAYLYLYSDLVVRRVGYYTYAAAVSLLMAELTLVLPHVDAEGLIAVLALTSLALHLSRSLVTEADTRLSKHLGTISLALAFLPTLIGLGVHLRSTSAVLQAVGVGLATGWQFVGVMVLLALTTRLSAWLCRKTQPFVSESYFFLSASALLIASAGLLRQLGWTSWDQQAPLLMLVPIGYIIASRLWRGHSPETPLAHVAHVATAVILGGTFVAALEQDSTAFFRAIEGQTENLLLGLTFLEATVFYLLAGMFRRRDWNAFLATLAGCGAMWQFAGYFGVPTTYYPLVFAGLGVAGLAAARFLGLEHVARYDSAGEPQTVMRGPGATVLLCGHAVLSLALVVAFLQGLGRLAGQREWLDLLVLILCASAGGLGVLLSPQVSWRRWYVTATVALGAVTFLTLNLLVDLSGWQKLEIFCVVAGVLLLVAGYVGLFREDLSIGESAALGLWLGSLLAAGALFIAMLYHRFAGDGPSLADEIALLTVTILMVATGCSWQVKATTLIGGSALVTYLLILIGSLAYRPQVAIGVYLLAGGAVLFIAGVVLSIYRERLLQLPEMIAKREGIFRVIGWR